MANTSTPQPALLSETPAPCPAWCTIRDHSHTRYTEDVRHQGPTLPPLDVPLYGGQVSNVLGVEVVAYARDNGTAGPVSAVVDVIDSSDALNELDAAGLRELAREVHPHADALADLADQLDSLN